MSNGRLDLSSLSEDTVLVWFDAGFHKPEDGPRVVIAAYEAEALVLQRPRIEPFPGAKVGYATEIGLAFSSYGFDAGLVLPSGVPSLARLAKLEAEFFDLCAAWSGLNYTFRNRHHGHVSMIGDGRSSIEFMRHENRLDLSRYGVETSAMRDIIEELTKEFSGVDWKWVPREENKSLQHFQNRLKRFLKDREPGRVELYPNSRVTQTRRSR